MGLSQDGTVDPQQAMAALSAALPMALLLFVVSIAAYLIIFAGILKLVIRGQKPSLPFYLGFGADEWRLLGTWLLMMLIFIGAEILIVIASALIGFLAVNLGGVGGVIAFVAILALFVALIWLCVRFSLATPATIGAETIGIGPSWNISKGNVWRLLGYWVIWGLILVVVEILVLLMVMPGYFQAMGDIFASGGDPAQLQRATQEMTDAALGLYDFSSPLNVLRLVLSGVIGALVFATVAVSGGVAWRLMTDESPEKHF